MSRRPLFTSNRLAALPFEQRRARAAGAPSPGMMDVDAPSAPAPAPPPGMMPRRTYPAAAGPPAASDMVEVDAAAPPPAAAAAAPLLHVIPLNLNIPIDVRVPLPTIDSIHCMAFGAPTGIEERESDRLHSFQIPDFVPIDGSYTTSIELTMPNGSKSHTYLVYMTSDENVIVMSILAFWSRPDTSETAMDIWSVAKNPSVDVSGTVEMLFENIRTHILSTIDVNHIFLYAARDNTLRMTENMRIRLYGSLGFNILAGEAVFTIYPPKDDVVVHQNDAGKVLLKDPADKYYCTYIGNIRARGDTPIRMYATKESFATKRSMFLGYDDIAKGKQVGLFHNTTWGVPPGHEAVRLDNNASVALPDVRPETLKPLVTLYHMGLTKKDYPDMPGNNYIDSIQVPDDFVIVTITSPGSYLYGTGPTLLTMAQEVIQRMLTSPDELSKFLATHRSMGKFPLYNIQDHAKFVTQAVAPLAEMGSQCDFQIATSMINSILVEQMGRQPIYEIPLTDEEARKFGYKKVQFDIQVYTGGMRMHNFTVERRSMKVAARPVNRGEEEMAKVDDEQGLGLFGKDIRYTDDDFVNPVPGEPSKTFLDLLNHIRVKIILKSSDKYLVFALGCASTNPAGDNYELLYELSHRRSVIHTFPAGTPADSPAFINGAFFREGLETLSGPPRSSTCPATGGKRRTRRRRMRKRTNTSGSSGLLRRSRNRAVRDG